MNKLKVIWDRIEKYAIYTAIFVFIILEFFSYFIPSIKQAMDTKGALLLIAVILLFFFKYIDERIGDSKNSPIEVEKSFSQGILETLEKKEEIETMDIFAHTGQKYLYALQESHVKVKHLRLLLRSFDNLDTIQFPADESDKQNLKRELKSVTDGFIGLKKQGKIQTLEIRYYLFDPTCHFFVVDKRLLHFGLFQPIPSSSGVQVLNSFVVKESTDEGRKLINDFRILFDTTYDEYGKEG